MNLPVALDLSVLLSIGLSYYSSFCNATKYIHNYSTLSFCPDSWVTFSLIRDGVVIFWLSPTLVLHSPLHSPYTLPYTLPTLALHSPYTLPTLSPTLSPTLALYSSYTCLIVYTRPKLTLRSLCSFPTLFLHSSYIRSMTLALHSPYQLGFF
jgi:hypothetical protein